MTRQQLSAVGWCHVDQSLPPTGAVVRGLCQRSVTHRHEVGLVRLVEGVWVDAATSVECSHQPSFWKPTSDKGN
jgi:hypothetical protein